LIIDEEQLLPFYCGGKRELHVVSMEEAVKQIIYNDYGFHRISKKQVFSLSNQEINLSCVLGRYLP